MFRKDSWINLLRQNLFVVSVFLYWSQAHAEVAGPGWLTGTPSAVTTEEAARYFDSTTPTSTLLIEAQSSVVVASATGLNPEITELAHALQNDPQLIYDYVHNNIDYVPYYGYLKGPTLTLIERSGNDFDQAALMINLLRASGYTAQYVYGQMTIPKTAADNQDLSSWLDGVSFFPSAILSAGGIPHTLNDSSVTLDRVWVKAQINGMDYVFDPAFKQYNEIAPINFTSAMGYDSTAVLAAAGGEVGSDYVRALDENALASLLTNYASTFVSYIRSNLPNSEIEEVTGGREIIATKLDALISSLPFTPVQVAVWQEIPDSYIHKLTVTHGSINLPLSIPDISDKKVAITYEKTTPTPNANIPASTCPGIFNAGNNWSYGNIYQDEWMEICRQIDSGTATVSFLSNPDGAFSIVEGGGVISGKTNIRVRFNGSTTPGPKTAIVRVFLNSINAFADFNLTGTVLPYDTAKLWMEDSVIAQGAVTVDANFRSTLSLDVNHPYVADNGTMADQNADFNVLPGATYIITSGFGGDAGGLLLNRRQRKLEKYIADGLDPGSREVLTEALHVVGRTWMQQTNLSDRMVGKVSGIFSIDHHRFGLVAQEEGYYIDIKLAYAGTGPSTTKGFFELYGASNATTMLGSAMEHGVLEQTQLGAKSAASTIKVLQQANAQGTRIYKLNGANSVTVSPQLSGYAASELQLFQDTAASGTTFILPQNVPVNADGWLGRAYIGYLLSASSSDIQMAIGGNSPGGGYFGGIGQGEYNIYDLSIGYAPQFDWDAERSNFWSLDPVNMTTGAYFYERLDIATGTAGPGQLAFKRSYNSDNANRDEGLGFGWTHNHNIKIDVHSDNGVSMGQRSAIDATTLIVAAVVTEGLLNDSDPSLKAWVTSAIVDKWAMDNFLNNAVSVNLNDNVLTFIRLPDGTYSSPPGVTTTLRNISGLFRLEDRLDRNINFDTNNRISVVSDADGNTTNYTYTSGSLDTVSSSFGPRLDFNYYPDGRLQQVSDTNGRNVNFAYDSAGDLVTSTDVDSKPWSYLYTNHRMTDLVDPLLITIASNTYDTRNRVETQTVPRQGGGTTTYNFYFADFRNIEEGPQGNQTVYFIDRKRRTVAIQDALGNLQQTEFDGQHHVVKQIDPRNNESAFTFDSNSNLRFTLNALSQQTENRYDTEYRVTDIIDPLNNTINFEYDAEHHLTLTRDPVANEFTATFYPDGKIQTQTDGRATTTTYVYDASGYPDTTRVAAHPAVDYAYDGIGRLVSLTDQSGATTSFLYDNRGNVTETTDPLLRKTLLTYDDAGRLGTITDRNGNLTDYNYTATGKLEMVDYANDPTVSFAYDIRDNLVSMTDSLGLTGYSYDVVNRLTSHTDSHGFTVGYRYDVAGNLDQLTYPGNKTVTYTYDALNRLKTVTIDWLAGAPTATYVYDAAGRLDTVTQFNGSVTDYTFDAASRLTSLVNRKADGTVISSHQFPQLDGNGNRLQEVREEPIFPALPTQTANFTYNPPRNRLISSTTDTFSYDNEGQQSNKSGTPYTFDDTYRLTRIGSNAQFFYDGANNRLKVTKSGITRKYIYDTSNNLLAEANNSNVIQRYYIHGAGLLGLVEGNNLYTYHYDATGNTLALTNASETLINTYSYEAYGRSANEIETIPQPFKYVGQYGVQYEAQENLYYMRARYYDPSIGRFISGDPTGFGGGDVNLYAYVGGNPTSNIDPSGTVCVPCAVIAINLARAAAPHIARGAVAGFNAARTFLYTNPATTAAVSSPALYQGAVDTVQLGVAAAAGVPGPNRGGGLFTFRAKVVTGIAAGAKSFQGLTAGASSSPAPFITPSNFGSNPNLISGECTVKCF